MGRCGEDRVLPGRTPTGNTRSPEISFAAWARSHPPNLKSAEGSWGRCSPHVTQNVARKGGAEGVASAVVPRAVLGDYLGGVSLKTPTIYSAENGSPKF